MNKVTLQAVPALGAVVTHPSSAALSWHCRVCTSSWLPPAAVQGSFCRFLQQPPPVPSVALAQGRFDLSTSSQASGLQSV